MRARGLAIILLCGAVGSAAHALPVPQGGRADRSQMQVAAKKKPRHAQPAAPAVPAIDPVRKAEFERFLALAEAGDRTAMYNVAFAYRQGDGVIRDEAAARAWHSRLDAAIERAADGGDTGAMAELASRYETGGNGLEADPAKAAHWYDRRRETISAKARSGDAAAMAELADLLDTPPAGHPDHDGALAWWRKAAEAGSHAAMRTLAQKLDDGIDIPADRAEAFAWYLKASGDPDDPWSARIPLAQKYKTGDGTPKNLEEAARLHVAIAEGYGGWRRRMRAETFADDVARSEKGYRRAVQRELSGRGLYAGPPDGEPSDALAAAIKKVWRSKVKDD